MMNNVMNTKTKTNIEDAVKTLPFSDLDDLMISRGPVADAYLEQALSLSLDRYLTDDELDFLSVKFYTEIYEYIVDNR